MCYYIFQYSFYNWHSFWLLLMLRTYLVFARLATTVSSNHACATCTTIARPSPHAYTRVRYYNTWKLVQTIDYRFAKKTGKRAKKKIKKNNKNLCRDDAETRGRDGKWNRKKKKKKRVKKYGHRVAIRIRCLCADENSFENNGMTTIRLSYLAVGIQSCWQTIIFILCIIF